MACGATGWLAGRMLEAAVSRQREFLADARAVQFTASSDGLRGMLRKAMAERASRNGPQGLAASRSLHPSVQHMLFVEPLAETRMLVATRRWPGVCAEFTGAACRRWSRRRTAAP